MSEIFPITIATGKAFCNRTNEKILLKQYIKHTRHVLLKAPRRYGKTSLVNQVLLELKMPYVLIELTMVTSAAEVANTLLKYVGQLINELLPRSIKAKQKILELFKVLNPEIVLTAGGQKLIFRPEKEKSNPVDNIADVLKKLDEAARISNKKVVIVMDEFQELNSIKESGIEAAIRHAMQYSQMVSYIFLGSNRHLLESMFEDKNRPFYNSCETISLDRILSDHYYAFIQDAAFAKWNRTLADSTLETIFKLTELHPSHVNRICGYFWLINKYPTGQLCKEYWDSFVESKHSEFTDTISALSKNQKKLLNYLAHHPVKQLSDHSIILAINIPEPSIRQSYEKLLSKDYLFRDKDNTIKIMDPALRDFILTL